MAGCSYSSTHASVFKIWYLALIVLWIFKGYINLTIDISQKLTKTVKALHFYNHIQDGTQRIKDRGHLQEALVPKTVLTIHGLKNTIKKYLNSKAAAVM